MIQKLRNTLLLKGKNTNKVYNIVWDGNSWIAGSGSTGGLTFPEQTKIKLQNDGYLVNYLNYGVAGQTIVQMQSDAVTQIDPLASTYQILIALEIVNQWGLTTDYTISQIYDLYLDYFQDRLAAGFDYVFACTPHDQGYYTRTAGGDWSTVQAWIINEIVTNFPGLGIGVINCGSDSRLSDYTDTTYFSVDEIHLNNVGQDVQASYAYDALKTLIL